jgi:hypothetical protein
MLPKPRAFTHLHGRPEVEIERRVGDRSMTYVAAFRCATGIVMCADTLETIGDTKNYVEKLEVPEDESLALAIGGAGVDDIIRPFTQEVMERVSAAQPSDKKQLQELIKDSITEVFTNDLPFLVLKRQHRTPHFLIAAQCKEGVLHLHSHRQKALQEPIQKHHRLSKCL